LYLGPGGGTQASGVAVSPDGSQVFATGTTAVPGGSTDFATVAYRTATGAKQWIRQYSANGRPMQAKAIAVSPDGTKVIVAGQKTGPVRTELQAVAYDAATGAELWHTLFDRSRHATGYAVTVSPDGAKVWMAASYGNGFSRAVPLGYGPATGALAVQGKVTGLQIPAAIAVSPDSSVVYLAGSGPGANIVAYNAATGARLWSRALCGFSFCRGIDVKVSPDGSTVYVAGMVPWAGPPDAFGTEAISAATGRKLWRQRFEQGISTAASLAVSPDGSMVFVTGTSSTGSGAHDYTTVAYHSSGSLAWADHYMGPVKNSTAASVAVSPDGSTVYVTGTSGARPAQGVAYTRIVTIASSAATGSLLWRANYGVRKRDSAAVGLAVSPDGSTVYVTGTSQRRRGSYLATIAYRG
jgi:DNA-binding beta-propeller fold protein YncE